MPEPRVIIWWRLCWKQCYCRNISCMIPIYIYIYMLYQTLWICSDVLLTWVILQVVIWLVMICVLFSIPQTRKADSCYRNNILDLPCFLKYLIKSCWQVYFSWIAKINPSVSGFSADLWSDVIEPSSVLWFIDIFHRWEVCLSYNFLGCDLVFPCS